MDAPLSIAPARAGDGARCEAVLRSLPEWFGIEEAIVEYRAAAERDPTWVARPAGGGDVIGFVTLRRHFSASGEIACLAIRREWHGRGFGRALVERVESELVRDGAEYLQVKTLGPSRENEAYASTRRFYEACGFRPLEETTAFWGEVNPTLMMVKRLAGPHRGSGAPVASA